MYAAEVFELWHAAALEIFLLRLTHDEHPSSATYKRRLVAPNHAITDALCLVFSNPYLEQTLFNVLWCEKRLSVATRR
jgi:hypothetical protein